MKNPFATVGYLGPDHFCDRQVETDHLISNIKNGRNSCLLAPRRLGKTSLIHHVFRKLPKYTCLYIDISDTKNLSGLLRKLVTALVNVTNKDYSIRNLISSLKINLEVDPFSGQYGGSLGWVKPSQEKKTAEEIFEALASRTNILIAFDEFQEVTNYEETTAEAWLRQIATHYPNIRFIYCGSHQRILQDMFANAKRPFYHSSDLIQLGKIDKSTYAEFMTEQMKKGGIKFKNTSLPSLIYDSCYGFTAYIQDVCNDLFASGEKTITEDLILKSIGNLIQRYEPYFIVYKKSLTEIQFQVLAGFSSMRPIYKITGKEFMQATGMTNASVVKKAVDSLQKSQFIYEETDVIGTFYAMDNPLFALWIERNFMKPL